MLTLIRCTNKIIVEFIDAGVVEKRTEPAWMDSGGNVVNEEDVFGCKVTHNITYMDWIIVLNEVGGNTS